MERKQKNKDIFDTLASLPSSDGYTTNDLYRDFRLVFFGTDEGKRVLRNILQLGCVFSEPELPNPIDPYALAQSRGRRWLALKILQVAQFEPKDKPQQTRKKPDARD